MSRKSTSEPEESDGSEFILLPASARPPPPIEPDEFCVHPSNWVAFQVFEMCQTQWRIVTGMSGAFYQGLEYPSVIAVINSLDIKKPNKVFNHVRLIEAGALSEINVK